MQATLAAQKKKDKKKKKRKSEAADDEMNGNGDTSYAVTDADNSMAVDEDEPAEKKVRFTRCNNYNSSIKAVQLSYSSTQLRSLLQRFALEICIY